MSTYVISDVHAHYDKFINFVNSTNENDTIFCLGDVIDKGPDGLSVLRHIMNDKRFQMLIGNHELMFLNVVLSSYLPAANAMGLTSYYKENWIKGNGGKNTFKSFIALSKAEQDDIINFLQTLPVLLNVTINEKDYILVHAFPENLGINNVYVKDIKHEYIDGLYKFDAPYVWKRQQIFVPNKTIITGHTFVQSYGYDKAICITDKNGDEWWDIDGGLAKQDNTGSLIVLKLDDMSVRKY